MLEVLTQEIMMIIQVNEQFHDHEEQTYFVETDGLKPESNLVDALVLKACKKNAFNQKVFINVDEKRDEDEVMWAEPHLTNAKVKLPAGSKPEKVVKLTLFFDC